MAYQPTQATEATKTRRLESLLAAATSIVAAQGFQQATVKAVAARAGMSVGNVYRFFPTKSDLLSAVFRRAADIELAAVRAATRGARARAESAHTPESRIPVGSAAAELTALVTCFSERALKGRQLAWSLLLEPVGRAIEVERLVYRKSYAELVADILARGIRSHECAAQDPGLSGAAIVGAIGEALTGPLSPLQGPGHLSADVARTREVVTAITELCLRAAGCTRSAPLPTGKAKS